VIYGRYTVYMKKIHELTDSQKNDLINNRWQSSESVWDTVIKTYDTNTRAYKNNPEWLDDLPKKNSRVRDNRIFVNQEAVINSLIANLPKPTIIPGRNTATAKALATQEEKFFEIKYQERNVKEIVRKGLRNLYFSRLIVLKPYWDPRINDFNVKAVKPTDIRFGKRSTKEEDSEFAIEEITDNLSAVLKRFPSKSELILKKFGYENDDLVMVLNPEVKYKEAWIQDYVIFQMDNLILGCIKNPYYDWDGLLITEEEEQQIGTVEGEARRNLFDTVRNSQDQRRAEKAAYMQKEMLAKAAQESGATIPEEGDAETPITYDAYYFNHFDRPRKPYIFATIFNNENTPIGQTDMITQAIPLQQDIDETKRNITQNARFVNGVWKIDSKTMAQNEAQKLRTETGGVVYGKNVKDGATRETGQPLPAFVVENLRDSRAEIDEIMAASSAFKGVREGQETKGGRLALVDQSFLRLNEMVQVVDYVNYELFNWFYQLAKIRYTEHHYAKTLGKEASIEVITLIQDDFQDGSEIRVIGGKTLPEDRQFKYEQAQNDVKDGFLSPVDYFQIAGYDTPNEKAKNRVVYDINKPYAVGITPEEMAKIAPPQQDENPPSASISYKDLPPDGQVQLAAKAGITLDPNLLIAMKMKTENDKKEEAAAKSKQQVQVAKPK